MLFEDIEDDFGFFSRFRISYVVEGDEEDFFMFF